MVEPAIRAKSSSRLVAGEVRPRQQLAVDPLGQRRLWNILRRHAQTGDLPGRSGRQVVGLDRRRFRGIGRVDRGASRGSPGGTGMRGRLAARKIVHLLARPHKAAGRMWNWMSGELRPGATCRRRRCGRPTWSGPCAGRCTSSPSPGGARRCAKLVQGVAAFSR